MTTRQIMDELKERVQKICVGYILDERLTHDQINEVLNRIIGVNNFLKELGINSKKDLDEFKRQAEKYR